MCFSATASFWAAAMTGGIGALALTRVSETGELPLASIPIIFGVQQAIEGGLWLSLRNVWPATYAPVLANAFVFVALVIWPVLIPIAVSLVETERRRRHIIAFLIPIGLLLAGYSGQSMLHNPFSASIAARSICYIGEYQHPFTALAVYALCTCGPLFISTDRVLRLFGVVVIFGSVVSALFFYASFISVWCFFAGAASIAIYLKLAQRHAVRTVVPFGMKRP